MPDLKGISRQPALVGISYLINGTSVEWPIQRSQAASPVRLGFIIMSSGWEKKALER